MPSSTAVYISCPSGITKAGWLLLEKAGDLRWLVSDDQPVLLEEAYRSSKGWTGQEGVPLIAPAAKVLDEFLWTIAVMTRVHEISGGDPGGLDYKAWEVILPTLKTKKLPWYTLGAFCRGLATLQHELGVAAS